MPLTFHPMREQSVGCADEGKELDSTYSNGAGTRYVPVRNPECIILTSFYTVLPLIKSVETYDVESVP
jgi:hypothetical protein